ncbi:hypothetical protein GCM10010211_13800 [Streptomyces albospinus]|uniref:Uncharacterized protein n=1 Tax=Streptomyces albospinus TaxID=285515 RepID=A0ABQ2USD6_9ACTN|nr:hypothetical protein GCM10010211_13800 [Streptomyces albospinus]
MHHRFPGRDELLEAAVRWCVDGDTERRAAGLAAAPDARAELLHLSALRTPRTEQPRRQWPVRLGLCAQAARDTAVGGCTSTTTGSGAPPPPTCCGAVSTTAPSAPWTRTSPPCGSPH